jgi:hypothetical protein
MVRTSFFKLKLLSYVLIQENTRQIVTRLKHVPADHQNQSDELRKYCDYQHRVYIEKRTSVNAVLQVFVVI